MGQQLCNHGKEGSTGFQQHSFSWAQCFQEIDNLPLSQRLKQSFGKRTLLYKKYQGNTWKILWYEEVSNADFNKGYWMVELHPESRKLTTMVLDIGRFQWTRLPMGSIVAQAVFQRKLDSIFLDVPDVTGIADDMIIYGRDNQEHNGNLLNFLEVCRKNTLTLNAEKMQFRLPKVSFFGHT